MKKKNKSLGVGDNRTVGEITGAHDYVRPNVDMADLAGGEVELIDGDGTQSGEHPAKTQPRVMRFFE